LRFYQQYKIQDFLEMDIRILSILVSGMGQVMAEEQLNIMDAISYPHRDDKGRKKQHREWSKLAYPDKFEQRIVKTTDLELF